MPIGISRRFVWRVLTGLGVVGLGMHSIPVRFNCPSEITLIVLRT